MKELVFFYLFWKNFIIFITQNIIDRHSTETVKYNIETLSGKNSAVSISF